MRRCPHGDETCPCQDGDSCHYEGVDPMGCPNPPPTLVQVIAANPGAEPAVSHLPHCHVEGCDWPFVSCGLVRLAPATPLHAADESGCGYVRLVIEDAR